MWEYGIYLGNESDTFHVDFVSTDHLFVVATIENSVDKEVFKGLFEKTRDGIVSEHVHDLAAFEKLLDREFKSLEKVPGFALAASLSVGTVLYLVTRGGGSVFIDRGPVFQKLISGDQTSSGYLQNQDLLVLTTEHFMARVSPPTLQRFIQGNTPQQIVESMAPDLKSNDDTGLIALFARFNERSGVEDVMIVGEDMEEEVVVESAPIYAAPAQNEQMQGAPARRFVLKNPLAGLRPGTSLGKKLTFITLIILVGIFIWSVILGNQRRQKNAFIKKVETESAKIDQQLEEASSLTVSNVDKSIELLNAAKGTYSDLKAEADKKKMSDLSQLEAVNAKITNAEKSIKKEADSATEEFYDLNLIEKGASATRMYYDGETLALLDSTNAKVYLLALAKKSVVSRKDSKISGGSLVSLHQDEPYVFGSKDGIFRVTKQKSEVLIEKDEEWGDIKDMAMYNGNIYVLDAGKDEIYKYLVSEGGYSAKNSYIKSGKADFANATSMTIDKSVYVVNGSRVLKYESGNSVSFSVKIPGGSDIAFDDIYTNSDIDNIYLLDKESKKIFIVSKEGEFLKQVTASEVANSTDFIVDKTEGILLLVKDKIIKISQ